MKSIFIISFRVVLLVSSFNACQTFVLGEDWPQFRGPNRDGRSDSTEAIRSWQRDRPRLIKTLSGAGAGYSSLCVVGSKIYTTGNSDHSQFTVCFDTAGKIPEWTKELVGVRPNHAEMGARSTPTWDQGRLYVTSSDGQLFCLDAMNQGEILWQKSFQKDFGGRLMSGWGYAESPLVDGDRVVVTPGGPDALVVALDKLTGKVLWKSKINEAIPVTNSSEKKLKNGAGYSSMIKATFKASAPQYVQFVGRGLVGIDCKTGQVLWSHSDSANSVSNICNPVFFENRAVYSSAPNGGLSILEFVFQKEQADVKTVKSYPPGNFVCHHGGMIQHDGYLFFGAGEDRGFPTCVELSTGKRKWGGTFRGPGRGSAATAYVAGKIIYRYQNGVVALVSADPSQYRPLGHFMQAVKSNNRSWSHPVVVDRKLLLREQDQIMIYDLN